MAGVDDDDLAANAVLPTWWSSSQSQATHSRFERRKKLGEGTYAVVYDSYEKETGKRVAIKKIKLGQMADGVNFAAIREVAALKELKHPNIIELLDVYYYRSNLNLVLEYLETDLEKIIQDSSLFFRAADIKSWMLMALRGLHHCHINWMLHRDIKPNNMLITSGGVLKLADFGLAKRFGQADVKMTAQVVTSFYRAPELLYGATKYSYGIDMWAMGCIFAELMLRTPYLPGESDVHQLETIFKALGTPTEADWPGMTSLPNYLSFRAIPKPPLRSLFTAAGDDALDLLEQLMRFDPLKRISAEKAFKHNYFTNSPRPTAPEKLPRPSLTTAPLAAIKRERDENDVDAYGNTRRKLLF